MRCRYQILAINVISLWRSDINALMKALLLSNLDSKFVFGSLISMPW